MRYVQAVLALGLFGYFGYAVLADALPASDSGSSKTRALVGLIENATERFGTTETGLGLIAVGILLAMFFVGRARQDAA